MLEADCRMKLWGDGTSPFLDSSALHTTESLLEKMIATPCCLCKKMKTTLMKAKGKQGLHYFQDIFTLTQTTF